MSTDEISNGKAVLFDWLLCLKQCGYNADAAKHILNLFVDELETHRDKIQQAWTSHNNEIVLHHIHKLHGASCYCGVPNLVVHLNQLESNFKSLDNDARQADLAMLDRLCKQTQAAIQAFRRSQQE